MIMEQPREVGQPRRKVWCSINDLTDNGDGTFSFKTLPQNALGYGSKVVAIDENKIFYYDDTNGLLYDWSDVIDGG